MAISETKSDSCDAEKAAHHVSDQNTTSGDNSAPANHDANLVDWDGPDDPAHPRNWTRRQKNLNAALVSLSVLYCYIARTAMFAAGPLLGPELSPIIGGFATQALGWRWVFYLVLMFAGAIAAISTATMRETNGNIILAKRAARLRKETGNMDLRPARLVQMPASQLFRRTLIRPLRMLLFSPIIALIGFYMALVFGVVYLLFATFPSVFQSTYGWSVGISGLAYLAGGTVFWHLLHLFSRQFPSSFTSTERVCERGFL